LTLRLKGPRICAQRWLTAKEAREFATEHVDTVFQTLIEHVANHDHSALRPLSHKPVSPQAASEVAAPTAVPTPDGSPAVGDILTTIERLAELRQKNIPTEEEFAAKKSELLRRL